MNTNKSVIHSNQFIILEMKKESGVLSLPAVIATSAVYEYYPVALHAAQELAAYNKDYKYIVTAVAAVCEHRPIDVPVITTYSL